ncbi:MULTISPECIES: hypothetical protein [unclassified Micromonospora]|uniref:hypothetical protein n=1 Tax=unclassified Micromonospora TaxID=2617518 RepID=UPI001C231E9C|nr:MULTISPECIES: hypothetical protein [unclassified Micromonospora]MBU8861323.1 hypothetical protein [Micromonospora sp. WMMB482]MDM4780878.1 hypothetical protein [Micromonospora sp. b486]
MAWHPGQQQTRETDDRTTLHRDVAAYPARFALVKRRHVDLMRVCSDACRRAR